jgi:hypothetical protein
LAQLQGGRLPSWQTTVVCEPGGTTTVVFAGGFGLPLLMQPQSIAEVNTSADKIFIVPPGVRSTPEVCVTERLADRSPGLVASWVDRHCGCRRPPTPHANIVSA